MLVVGSRLSVNLKASSMMCSTDDCQSSVLHSKIGELSFAQVQFEHGGIKTLRRLPWPSSVVELERMVRMFFSLDPRLFVNSSLKFDIWDGQDAYLFAQLFKMRQLHNKRS